MPQTAVRSSVEFVHQFSFLFLLYSQLCSSQLTLSEDDHLRMKLEFQKSLSVMDHSLVLPHAVSRSKLHTALAAQRKESELQMVFKMISYYKPGKYHVESLSSPFAEDKKNHIIKQCALEFRNIKFCNHLANISSILYAYLMFNHF